MNLKLICIVIVLSIAGYFFICRTGPINNWQIEKINNFEQILFLGDSLTTGYGMSNSNESYPEQLGKMLNKPIKVFGYNGYTTKKGLEVVDNLVTEKPSLVIVTLGGNDILQRMSLLETEANLAQIFEKLQKMGHKVVFTEVLGLLSDSKRHAMHKKVCQQFGIAMVPDILKGLLTDTEAMQADSIHPQTKGCKIIAEMVAEILKSIHHIE